MLIEFGNLSPLPNAYWQLDFRNGAIVGNAQGDIKLLHKIVRMIIYQ